MHQLEVTYLKKIITMVLAVILMITCTTMSFANAGEITFGTWTENNRYVGEEETSTLASKLDRANLAYILTEAFDFNTDVALSIDDVSPDDWEYKYVCAVINRGIMELENNRFFPDEYVERQQIPQYFKFLDLSYPPITNIPFEDADTVSAEYKDMFDRFVVAGYLQPVSGNYLLPTRIITITETISMLNRMFPNVPNKVMKDSTYDGHFILRGSTTYLSDVEITGDLIISEGIILKNKNFADNTITLENIKVDGNIYILGGSLLGKFNFNGVTANDIVVMGEEPVIMSFRNCDFMNLNLGNVLANIVTDKDVNISRT